MKTVLKMKIIGPDVHVSEEIVYQLTQTSLQLTHTTLIVMAAAYQQPVKKRVQLSILLHSSICYYFNLCAQNVQLSVTNIPKNKDIM